MGYTLEEVKLAGCMLEEAMLAGYMLEEVEQAGYTVNWLSWHSNFLSESLFDQARHTLEEGVRWFSHRRLWRRVAFQHSRSLDVHAFFEIWFTWLIESHTRHLAQWHVIVIVIRFLLGTR